ncbi:hypothetical protein FOZ60_012425 [Perkinsus olseni]|uniref:Methyltransferase domain-containing protein n=1 Tax=Perkinsus olseni TaxID=32597 RepID=A0A7J6NBK8_PEROL|nr:hypothetical protein FOZ60_012425 [Perkinsus olseni]
MAPNRVASPAADSTGNPKSIVSVGPTTDYSQFVEDTAASLRDGRIPKLPSAPLDQIFKRDMIPQKGLILDFGIGTGWFTRYIAGQLNGRKMYGFDSFKGLPSDWVPQQGAMPETAKGSFAQTKLPEMPDNVELVVGMFDDTLPDFAQQHNNDTIALLHNDSVMYESTVSIFKNLGHMIVPGTIIVMDELFDYPQYADHELKGFFEFLVARSKVIGEDCKFEWIGTGDVLLEDCFTDPKYEYGIYVDPTGAKLVSQDINLLMRCGIRMIKA